MDSKFIGITMTWSAGNICNTLEFAEFDDDIVGSDPIHKSMYWIESTLDDDIGTDFEQIAGLVFEWLKTDASSYLAFTIEDLGEVTLHKRFTNIKA